MVVVCLLFGLILLYLYICFTLKKSSCFNIVEMNENVFQFCGELTSSCIVCFISLTSFALIEFKRFSSLLQLDCLRVEKPF